MRIRLQPLGENHNRAAFSSGKLSVDDFLKKIAKQRQAKGLGTTMVATDADGDPNGIVGSYYVVLHEFRGAELPDPWRVSLKTGNLSRIPGALLAQLGVHKPFQGQGIGKVLVRAVFARTTSLVDTGCAALVTDPIDETAEKFYAAFDFRPLGDGSKRMIVAMKTIVAAVTEFDTSPMQD